MSACLPASTEAAGVTPLEGQWDMTGQGGATNGSSFQGGLAVRSTSASGFAGAYDALETSTQGAQRRLNGAIGGRMVGTGTVEFDVALPGVTRRHVATLTADTLRGNWFDVATAGTVEASGNFRAVRR